jgi:hypothetical protein
MTDAADTIQQALTRLSNDRRRTANNMINATARPGTDPTARRIMSDTGFLQERQFSYFSPNNLNFSFSDTDDPREINRIAIVPYGWRADIQRLTSGRPADRVIRSADSTGGSGVAPYPENTQYLMPGYLDADAYVPQKTSVVVRAATTTQGPAPHFIVSRRGDVLVGPPVDAETAVIPDMATGTIFIATEAALIIRREDHQASDYSNIIELPLAPMQIVSLAVLCNKLLVALGASFPRTFDASAARGFSYVRSENYANLTTGNFESTAPTFPWQDLRLDYTGTVPTAFSSTIDQQGTYDLSTDIWLLGDAPSPVAGREEVRAALYQLDTSGAEAAALGAYVTLAVNQRSNEMQTAARNRMFVQRRRVSYRDADDAANHAAAAATTVNDASLVTAPATGYEPHAYNFETGRWLEPDPETNSPSY